MEETAIQVGHVSKTFKLPHDKATSVKSSLINHLKRQHGYSLQHALTDIHFDVKKGEFFGIVGKNGGGKSTLLKIISGIYAPSKGVVQVRGKLTPFIELGVGFNPELTGRENVYLNGALLGFNRKEMQAMYKDIVAFAELNDFMDQKLKNYSSGMQVRLAFSIAIRAQSDILVMDEVLAVGDAAFQKKCFDVFRELKKQKRTIILVTHDMANVERFCDRVLVINKGKQLGIMSAAEASSVYAQLNVDERERERGSAGGEEKVRLGTGEVTVKSVKLVAGGAQKIIKAGEPLSIELVLERRQPYQSCPLQIGFAFFDEDNLMIAGPNNLRSSLSDTATRLRFTMPRVRFHPGDYKISIAVYDKDGIDRLDYLEKWLDFSVISDHTIIGLVEAEGEWKEA